MAVLCFNPKIRDEDTQFNSRKVWFLTGFLNLFNNVCKISVLLSVGIIVCGILFAFGSQKTEFTFFGGIEMAVLGIVEAVITVMWIVGVRA